MRLIPCGAGCVKRTLRRSSGFRRRHCGIGSKGGRIRTVRRVCCWQSLRNIRKPLRMPCGRRVSVPGTGNALQEIFGRRGVPKIAEGLTVLITMVYVQVGGYPAMAPFSRRWPRPKNGIPPHFRILAISGPSSLLFLN